MDLFHTNRMVTIIMVTITGTTVPVTPTRSPQEKEYGAEFG